MNRKAGLTVGAEVAPGSPSVPSSPSRLCASTNPASFTDVMIDAGFSADGAGTKSGRIQPPELSLEEQPN